MSSLALLKLIRCSLDLDNASNPGVDTGCLAPVVFGLITWPSGTFIIGHILVYWTLWVKAKCIACACLPETLHQRRRNTT
jgi:hypothetical protein